MKTPSSSFTHLHTHSEFSIFNGICRIEDYIRKASTLGMKHLGLTDYGNLHGAMLFTEKCQQAGINPVVGCEVYVAADGQLNKSSRDPGNFHLVLYASDEEGYRNLMILTSKASLEGFYNKPRVDDELLKRYHYGLIASTACSKGEIPQLILANNWEAARDKALYYNTLFGEGKFWLEVMNHGLPDEKIVREGIRRINRETGIPIIATNNVHFLEKEHFKAHEVFICIDADKKLSDTMQKKSINHEFYFKNEEEMQAAFPDFHDGLENTVKLAELCKLRITRREPLLPHFEIPMQFAEGKDYLRDITVKGLKERYPDIEGVQWKQLLQRADFELNLLSKLGFVDYFLIVRDYVDWSRRQGIPVGPGRGTAAGSIVAYALKITDIDPIKYGLLFERFLNSEVPGMPDIDVDFCHERRGEVIEYIHQKYGPENVAGISTFGTLKSRKVLKDVARVLNIPFIEWEAASKLLPKGKIAGVEKTLSMEPNLKDLFDVAAVLEGLVYQRSAHACGIVIGRSVLTDYVPLVRDEETGNVITAYTSDRLESCGLVKMDLLGLTALTRLKACESLVQVCKPDFSLERIPEDDALTFSLLGEGRSEAVFQFESPGMQKILKDTRPVDLEDLIALNALYRPGLMQLIPHFIELRHGRRELHYPHPDLEEVLKPTYGIIIYQEQLMKIAQIIGGLSPGKSDYLRRVMGKGKAEDILQVEQVFIQGAGTRGYSPDLALNIFKMLRTNAGIAFNKSHAASYTLLAYETAYCKAHFPTEFLESVIQSEKDHPEKQQRYIRMAQIEGIRKGEEKI